MRALFKSRAIFINSRPLRVTSFGGDPYFCRLLGLSLELATHPSDTILHVNQFRYNHLISINALSLMSKRFRRITQQTGLGHATSIARVWGSMSLQSMDWYQYDMGWSTVVGSQEGEKGGGATSIVRVWGSMSTVMDSREGRGAASSVRAYGSISTDCCRRWGITMKRDGQQWKFAGGGHARLMDRCNNGLFPLVWYPNEKRVSTVMVQV